MNKSYFKLRSLVVAVFVYFALLGVVQIDAYTLSPSSGTVEVGGTYTITIYADPGNPGSDTSAQIELVRSNSNINITNSSISTSGTLTSGVCTGGVSHTTSNVCFIYGNAAGISNGTVLGNFTFTPVATGTVSINVNSTDPAYEPSGKIMSGTLATFNVGAAGTGTVTQILPSAGLFDDGLDSLFLGMTFISIGAFLIFIEIKKAKQSSEFYKGTAV